MRSRRRGVGITVWTFRLMSPVVVVVVFLVWEMRAVLVGAGLPRLGRATCSGLHACRVVQQPSRAESPVVVDLFSASSAGLARRVVGVVVRHEASLRQRGVRGWFRAEAAGVSQGEPPRGV
jgi:hypothetical protein